MLLSEPIAEGGQVALTLILTLDGIEYPDEDPFQTNASVMWVAPNDDGAALVGLRFVKPEAEQTLRLRRFLAAIAEAR